MNCTCIPPPVMEQQPPQQQRFRRRLSRSSNTTAAVRYRSQLVSRLGIRRTDSVSHGQRFSVGWQVARQHTPAIREVVMRQVVRSILDTTSPRHINSLEVHEDEHNLFTCVFHMST
jgi:hypothetical protein